MVFQAQADVWIFALTFNHQKTASMKKAKPYSVTLVKYRYKLLVVALPLLTFLIIQGCTKQQSLLEKNTIQTAVESSNAAVNGVTKQQALQRLNEHFKDDFATLKMKQVTGVSKEQFLQWLRTSKAAEAESLYLSPLLASDSNEYIILKDVTLKPSGQKASVGLIGTTKIHFNQYTRMVAVINPNIVLPNKHLCSWKKCDSYSPCPCINWLDFVYGDCPSDRCSSNFDCRGYSGSDCDGELTGITTFETIEAF